MAGKMVLYKLVVMGDSSVGKTALTIQLCLQYFVETVRLPTLPLRPWLTLGKYDPTIEDSYQKKVVIDDEACMLEVLDTAGQKEYTTLHNQWIQNGEGFVLVYSISSRLSFSQIKRFHHQIKRVKEGNNQTPVPIMLVGNKNDRVTEREVSTHEGHALARELGCEFVEVSVKNCVNVEKAFYDVVRLLRRQRQQPGKGKAEGSGAKGESGRYQRKKRSNSRQCTVLWRDIALWFRDAVTWVAGQELVTMTVEGTRRGDGGVAL